MMLLVLALALALPGAVAYPASGKCAQLLPPHGVVFLQNVVFSPGGVVAIPMLATDTQYMEIWSHVQSPLVGPPEGAQYGVMAVQTPSYNTTSPCVYNLSQDALITPSNYTYTPQPGGPLTLAPLGDVLLLAGSQAGQVVGGYLTRMTGLPCELTLAKIQEYLAKGVPRKTISVNTQAVCWS